MRSINLVVERTVDFGVLDAEMRAVFGERISGISMAEGRVIVHVLEQGENDVDLARAVLAAHNADLVRVERPMAVNLQTRVEPLRKVRSLWR